MNKINIAAGEAVSLMLALMLCGCENEIEVPDELPGSIEERPYIGPSAPDSVSADTIGNTPPAGMESARVFGLCNADGVVVYYHQLSAGTCEVAPASEVAAGGETYSGRVEIPAQVACEGQTLTVVGIAERAFERSEVTEVILPPTLTQIGAYAFQYSTELRRLVIPGGLKRIETCLCRGCTSLTSVIIEDGVTCIGKLAFTKCTALAEVCLPGSMGVIDVGAFQGCTSLATIEIPRYVSTINDYAFSRCGLTSFAYPDRVQVVSEGVFQNCLALATVSLPSSLTSIGSYAFAGCAGLNHIVLPEPLSWIGSHAFAYCPSLCWVRALPALPPLCDDDSFCAEPAEGIAIRLEVPVGSEDAYGTAPVWQRFAQIISEEGE